MSERTRVFNEAYAILGNFPGSYESKTELAYRAADAVAIGDVQVMYEKEMILFKPDNPEELERWSIDAVKMMAKNSGVEAFVEKEVKKLKLR